MPPRTFTGNSRGYLRHKLARAGRNDLLNIVDAGKLSTFSAAEAAGLRKRPPTLGTVHAQRQRREFALHPHRATRDQEMWLGVGHQGSAFASEAEAEAYWFQHRDRLWPMLCVDGKRPQAWWHFEAKLRYPGIDEESAALYEMGELGEVEERELIARWRHEFERANAPGFWHCLGVGRHLHGVAARHAHYAWAGIAYSLLLVWTRDRLHAARRIRKLRAEAAASSA